MNLMKLTPWCPQVWRSSNFQADSDLLDSIWVSTNMPDMGLSSGSSQNNLNTFCCGGFVSYCILSAGGHWEGFASLFQVWCHPIFFSSLWWKCAQSEYLNKLRSYRGLVNRLFRVQKASQDSKKTRIQAASVSFILYFKQWRFLTGLGGRAAFP